MLTAISAHSSSSAYRCTMYVTLPRSVLRGPAWSGTHCTGRYQSQSTCVQERDHIRVYLVARCCKYAGPARGLKRHT